MLIVSITNSRVLNDWDLTTDRLKNLILVLGELIDIRYGYKTCDELSYDDDVSSYWICAQIKCRHLYRIYILMLLSKHVPYRMYYYV